MSAFLITDLHLTDLPRDEYRWKLFTWLPQQLRRNRVHELFILGDLTQDKDYHSGRLVNRVVGELLRTCDDAELQKIYILRGNHDSLDPNCAFFRFLGRYPKFCYVETPFMAPFKDREVLLLPHSRDPEKAWETVEMQLADFIFMHATIQGAVAENGQPLPGVLPKLLSRARRARIYSGDVHVPQTMGAVTYVGAPYPIHFGDKFSPRAILLENYRTEKSIPIPSIQRRLLTVTPTAVGEKALAGLDAGDQIKIRLRLTPSEYGDWQKYKHALVEACSKKGIELCGLELEREATQLPKRPRIGVPVPVIKRDPTTIVNDFCAANKLSSELKTVGLQLLKENETVKN